MIRMIPTPKPYIIPMQPVTQSYAGRRVDRKQLAHRVMPEMRILYKSGYFLVDLKVPLASIFFSITPR